MRLTLTPFNLISAIAGLIGICIMIFSSGGGGLGGVIILGVGVLMLLIDVTLQFIVHFIHHNRKYFWLRAFEVIAIAVTLIGMFIHNSL